MNTKQQFNKAYSAVREGYGAQKPSGVSEEIWRNANTSNEPYRDMLVCQNWLAKKACGLNGVFVGPIETAKDKKAFRVYDRNF